MQRATSHSRGLVLVALGVLVPLADRASCSGFAAEPQVTARLSTERVYLGETLRCRVTILHDDSNSEPRLESSDDFQVRFLGQVSSAMSVVTIINGKRQEYTEGGPTYEYVLTPRRSGTLSVPVPFIEVGGRKYQAAPLQLQVLDPSEQDLVILEMSADRERCYPLQPFTVRLTIALKPLPEPYQDRDPLSAVVRQMPHLTLPWADDENLAEGLAATEPAGVWLRSYLATSPNDYGFSMNNVHTTGRRRFGGGIRGLPGVDDLFEHDGFPDPATLFSMLNDERRAAFLPPSRRALRTDRQATSLNYWEYVIERTFVAKKPGQWTFGPATMQGVFVARLGGGRSMERIHALARAITVDVGDAPLTGRPDSYIGAVGRIEARSELTPSQVKVGDPMTLTIVLRGEGTLDTTTPPPLDRIPAIRDAFKMYEATQETAEGTRRFIYSLRPLHTGVTAFPAVPISYFDVQREEYVTLMTDPIPIQVAAADKLTGQDIAMAPVPGARRGPEVAAEGVFANITDASLVVDERVRFDRWAAILGTMLVAFLAIVGVTSHAQQRRADIPGQRRRMAGRRATKRLEEARPLVAAGNSRQTADVLRIALTGFIADVAIRDEQGLTSGEVVRFARDLGVDESILARLSAVLEHCDAARYGAWQKPLDSLFDEARMLLDELIRTLRSRKLVS